MICDLHNGSILVTGVVTRDASYRYVGAKNTPVCSFSVAAGKRKDTTTIFVEMKCWRALARYASLVRKGDSVCAIGSIEEREYNGKTYKNLVCDWLNVVTPSMQGASPAPQVPADAPVPAGFSELSDADGELPF